MKLAATVSTPVSGSVRARQLGSMFDCPVEAKQTRSWAIEAPIEDKPWSVGLIVGPSGSGKSTLLRQFGQPAELDWPSLSVIDDFSPEIGMQQVADACQAVGFNTIPAWLRPYSVLSNGEQFRVTLARLLAEQGEGVLCVDEFSSVVDRQVAKIASYAAGKYARRQGRQFVAASCHEDVIDWLRPDWIIRPDLGSFEWCEVSPRPKSMSRSRLASMRSGGGSLRITI